MKKEKTKPDYRKAVSVGAFDLRPLEVAEERAMGEELSARTV